MNLPLKKKRVKYTFEDYQHWPDGERWEIIDGEAFCMSPAPSREHQRISGILFYSIFKYLEDKSCEVYEAPFDVILSDNYQKNNNIYTVVQPDIAVICDQSKLNDKGCNGAPDFIIEITSPQTESKDMKEKLLLYERYGIKEYWIINPSGKYAMIYTMDRDGKYGRPGIYSEKDKIKSTVLKDFKIDLNTVFKYKNEKKSIGSKPPAKRI